MENKNTYAVIFDMDGVILDTESIARVCWKEAASEYGYELEDSLFVQLLGLSKQGSYNVLKDALGEDFPVEEVRSRRYELGEEYVREHGINVKEGLKELISFLEEQAVPWAIATSTWREEATRRLQAAGVLDLFSVMVTGDEIERGKPEPDIFLKAAEKLSVQAESCFVVEDSDAGVFAASRADMKAIMVPDLKPPCDETKRLAYRICTSLIEVKDFFISNTQSAP